MHAPALLLALAALLLAVRPAAAAPPPAGTVTQAAGAQACIGEGAPAGCTAARGMNGIGRGALTRDGGTLLLPAAGTDSIAVVDVAPSGALTQPALDAGCVAPPGNAIGCRAAMNLDAAAAVAVSPDGKHAYLAGANGLATFTLPPGGGLFQQAGGCLSPDDTAQPGNVDNACADGRALRGLSDVAVTPDGTRVLATVDDPDDSRDGVVVLARDAATGALTQGTGPFGCTTVSGAAHGDTAPPSGCGGPLRAFTDPSDLLLSADGRTAYVATRQGVAVLRPTAEGFWQQPGDATGCVVSSAQERCVDGRGLGEPWSLALSSDGRSLYVANSGVAEVAHLHVEGGGLAQAADPTACAAAGGAASDGTGPCANARVLGGFAPGIAVAPDGRTVAAGGANATGQVVQLDRVPGGALSQAADARGCFSQTGASGCAVVRGSAGASLHFAAAGARLLAAGGGSVASLAREAAPVCAPAPGAVTRAPQAVGIAFPCSDANGDPVVIELVGPPALGSVSVSGTTATYTPRADASGADGFLVRGSDGTNGSDPVAATVEVAAAPPAAGAGPGPRPAAGARPGTVLPPAALPALRSKVVRLDRRRRVALVALHCPSAAQEGCAGRVAATARLRRGTARRLRDVTVLTGTYRLRGGQRRTVRVPLTRAGRSAVNGRRRLAVRLVLRAPATSKARAAQRAVSATVRR